MSVTLVCGGFVSGWLFANIDRAAAGQFTDEAFFEIGNALAGRETAKMLQFKINPALLFDPK